MKVQKNLAIGFIRTKLNLLSVLNKRKSGEEAFRLFCTPLSRYKGKEADVFKNGEKLEFEISGNKIKGYRCNFPQQKKVLLLHGFTSTCHKFDKYAIELIGKGYEVLAFDAPAHGFSEGITVTAVDYCAMIKKVNELYGPIDAFVSHSFGGMAASFALEEIPHDHHTKLVLIAPATETSSAIDGAFAMLGISSKVIRDAMEDVIFALSGKKTDWFSVRRAMKNIRASVLWVHDEDDLVTPLADAIKVKEDQLSNVQFLITKGLGHQKIYKDAGVKNSIINFL
ncbi:MAG: alpha/beta hydrolase [Gloeobacteraceae cyanobacterium ES-bin-316]|nr:alpha/beta hydrolase [Ferruginibacter sp.]